MGVYDVYETDVSKICYKHYHGNDDTYFSEKFKYTKKLPMLNSLKDTVYANYPHVFGVFYEHSACLKQKLVLVEGILPFHAGIQKKTNPINDPTCEKCILELDLLKCQQYSSDLQQMVTDTNVKCYEDYWCSKTGAEEHNIQKTHFKKISPEMCLKQALWDTARCTTGSNLSDPGIAQNLLIYHPDSYNPKSKMYNGDEENLYLKVLDQFVNMEKEHWPLKDDFKTMKFFLDLRKTTDLECSNILLWIGLLPNSQFIKLDAEKKKFLDKMKKDNELPKTGHLICASVEELCSALDKGPRILHRYGDEFFKLFLQHEVEMGEYIVQFIHEAHRNDHPNIVEKVFKLLDYKILSADTIEAAGQTETFLYHKESFDKKFQTDKSIQEYCDLFYYQKYYKCKWSNKISHDELFSSPKEFDAFIKNDKLFPSVLEMHATKIIASLYDFKLGDESAPTIETAKNIDYKISQTVKEKCKSYYKGSQRHGLKPLTSFWFQDKLAIPSSIEVECVFDKLMGGFGSLDRNAINNSLHWSRIMLEHIKRVIAKSIEEAKNQVEAKALEEDGKAEKEKKGRKEKKHNEASEFSNVLKPKCKRRMVKLKLDNLYMFTGSDTNLSQDASAGLEGKIAKVLQKHFDDYHKDKNVPNCGVEFLAVTPTPTIPIDKTLVPESLEDVFASVKGKHFQYRFEKLVFST